MIECFYAYPSEPSIRYTVENAINLINNAGYDVHIIGWHEEPTVGQLIIEHICAAIDDCDLFICDLTYINSNVLFELGYAIANNKRIWITVDCSLYEEDRFNKELYLLSTFGQSRYRNAEELMGDFLKKEPYKDLSYTIYNTKINTITQSDVGDPRLFYMKCHIPTDSSLELSRFLDKSKLPMITDDPEEFSNRPFEWYVETVYRSFAVIAQLLDDNRNRKTPQNAKYSFICGMAYGFGKPLLMLAHSPFKAPIDYKDILFTHVNPTQCVSQARTWIDENQAKLEKKRQQYRSQRKKLRSAAALQRINLGQYVAEDELANLDDYFVPTTFYQEALNISDYRIFVGRKGTGKTANMYQLARELQNVKGQYNHVCIVKPLDYELKGIFELLQLAIPNSEKSNLIESLWKYIVITELAFNLYEKTISKPSGMLTSEEKDLVDFIESETNPINSDLSLRTEHAIEKLVGIERNGNAAKTRKKVSEILHESVIGQLRRLLGKILSQNNNVFILIDNLDKTWEKGQSLAALSDFLFGLLSVAQNIPAEFQKRSSKLENVNLSLIIFLRSDIFHEIVPYARERDKLKFTRINWNETRQLELVIEKRIANSLKLGEIGSEETWNRCFVSSIGGIPTRKFLVEHVVPRPRDIIFLCKQALSHAINAEHEKVEEIDIRQALSDYSEHAWSALIAQTEVPFPKIEDLLIEFAGKTAILTRDEVEDILKQGKTPKRKLNTVIEHLKLNIFLGLETKNDYFEFIYDGNRSKVLQKLAQNVAKETGTERYLINPVFHPYLQII